MFSKISGRGGIMGLQPQSLCSRASFDFKKQISLGEVTWFSEISFISSSLQQENVLESLWSPYKFKLSLIIHC